MNLNLETQRLLLHPLKTSHADMYAHYLIRNADFFKKWSPEYDKRYFDAGYHEEMIANSEKEVKEGRYLKFAVFMKPDTNRIIGTVSFTNIIKGPFQSCFLGYRIDEKENGKGFATESVGKGIEYMFGVVMLHRIEANIIPYNTASIKVAEKLGFSLEGYSRNYLKIDGKWQDHLHYVLLNEKS